MNELDADIGPQKGAPRAKSRERENFEEELRGFLWSSAFFASVGGLCAAAIVLIILFVGFCRWLTHALGVYSVHGG